MLKTLCAVAMLAATLSACGSSDPIYGIDIAAIQDENNEVIKKYSETADPSGFGLIACAFMPLGLIEEVVFSKMKSLEEMGKLKEKELHPLRLVLKDGQLSITPDDAKKIKAADSAKDFPSFKHEKIDNIDFVVMKEKQTTCRIPLKPLS